MKEIGITRQIDDLGRMVLPVELRKTLDISARDSMEIYLVDDTIVLKKFQTKCVFCGSLENIVDFKGKNVCKTCIAELK